MSFSNFLTFEWLSFHLKSDLDILPQILQNRHNFDIISLVLHDSIDTNMVYLRPLSMNTGDFLSRLKENGVLAGASYGSIRLVTHYGINSEDIDEVIESILHSVKDWIITLIT